MIHILVGDGSIERNDSRLRLALDKKDFATLTDADEVMMVTGYFDALMVNAVARATNNQLACCFNH